jgi:prophage DNA circulation protein
MPAGLRPPPVFDQLPKFSFGGIVFPVEGYDVAGGIRDHIHEYPHAAGGAPEKLGRRLYTVKVRASFQATFDKYPGLWPTSLAKLIQFFEAQKTLPLVIPTKGTIQAYCRNWSSAVEAKVRSGERVDLEFVEDQSQANLISALVNVSTKNITTTLANYNAAKILADFSTLPSTSIFDAISNAANAFLAIGDMTQAATNLVSAKLTALVDLIKQVDQADFVKDPKNYPLITALHDLWDAAQTQAANINRKAIEPAVWVVSAPMAMSAIASALYGDTSRQTELMQLNAVEDVLRVPAGTAIRYYPAAA